MPDWCCCHKRHAWLMWFWLMWRDAWLMLLSQKTCLIEWFWLMWRDAWLMWLGLTWWDAVFMLQREEKFLQRLTTRREVGDNAAAPRWGVCSWWLCQKLLCQLSGCMPGRMGLMSGLLPGRMALIHLSPFAWCSGSNKCLAFCMVEWIRCLAF